MSRIIRDLALRVLVDGEGIDITRTVSFPQPLELSDDHYMPDIRCTSLPCAVSALMTATSIAMITVDQTGW